MRGNQLTVDIDEVIRLAINTAIEAVDRRKEERISQRVDRRLRNTELLLKQYRAFAIHKDASVYSLKDATAIIDELDTFDEGDEYCFKALEESKKRTAIVVAHIDTMLEAFRYLAESERLKPEFLLGYKIIRKLYIDDEVMDFVDILRTLAVSQRTFYRRKTDAIQLLSGLIFGVDSVKLR